MFWSKELSTKGKFYGSLNHKSDGNFNGDVKLSLDASLKNNHFGLSPDFSVKNTLKFGIAKKEKEMFKFNGIDTEISYNNTEKAFAAYAKFSDFKVREIGAWHKRGSNSFAVDAKFCDHKCPVGTETIFKTLTAYGQTELDDNWKVGMKITPAMNFAKLK